MGSLGTKSFQNESIRSRDIKRLIQFEPKMGIVQSWYTSSVLTRPQAPARNEVPVGWCVDCGMAVYVRVQLALSFVSSIGYV